MSVNKESRLKYRISNLSIPPNQAGFDTRSYDSGDLAEGKVRRKPRLMLCLTMLMCSVGAM